MKRVKITAAVLALCLSLTLILPASAVKSVSEEEAAQVVGALNIMVGDSSGNLNLDRNVTRAEFITMAVKASPQGNQVGEAAASPYPDVPRRHWAAGFVEAGVRSGLITGYLDGTFRPNNNITLAEGVTIALKLLGYSGSDFSGAYPTAQMAMYHSMGLDTNMSACSSSGVMTRRDCLYLFYNLLSVKNKSGQPYLNTLGYSLNAAGEVDRVALLGQVMEGPIVADGDSWKSRIPFSLSGAGVYRGGSASTLSAIQDGDLIYWNEGMRRLWVYHDRITGTIQSLTPSPANPTAVTVGGRTYPIETDAAAYALSDLGEYRQGDAVTLLLGRTGGAAAVQAPSAGDSSKTGIVTAVGKQTFTAANGSAYTADSVTFLGTDGQTYSYECQSRSFHVGSLVQVRVEKDGTAAVRTLRPSRLSGKVSSDASMLGKYPIAADVEILDTYQETGVQVYPSRLAGINLTEDMVYYYALNARGEIQCLVLKDATGDMHHYGIVTYAGKTTSMAGSQSSYTVVLGGQTVNISSNTIYPVSQGPCVLKGSLTSPEEFAQLKSISVEHVEGNVVTSGSQSYMMFDSSLVYEYRDGNYYLSNLDQVSDGNHSLTAWYDKPQNEGGCVRVLIAREK